MSVNENVHYVSGGHRVLLLVETLLLAVWRHALHVVRCLSVFAFLRTSSSELPRISKLHPGVTSLHFRTFVMGLSLQVGGTRMLVPVGS